jgi:hypothetical protein
MLCYGPGGKPKPGFPPRPQPLEIAKGAIPTFPPLRLLLCLLKTKTPNPKPKKGDPGKLATQPPSSGSFLDEKMLSAGTSAGSLGKDLIISRPIRQPGDPSRSGGRARRRTCRNSQGPHGPAHSTEEVTHLMVGGDAADAHPPGQWKSALAAPFQRFQSGNGRARRPGCGRPSSLHAVPCGIRFPFVTGACGHPLPS